MTTYNIPLELTSDFNIKYGFDVDDGYLDLYQIFSLLNHQNIAFLFPDNASKIVTQIYNNDTYPVFEKFMNDLSINSNSVIIHIKTIDGKKRRNTVNIFYNGYQYHYTQKNKISVSKIKDKWNCNTISIIIEYNDSIDAAFGHYGGVIYDYNNDINKIYMFDSMMGTDDDIALPSEYSRIFAEIIKNDIFIFDYNGKTDPQIVYDIYRSPDSVGVYPFEITGGALDLPNEFIENAKLTNKSKINRYIHCSDNQNQFCYMWVFLYLSLKLSIYNTKLKGRDRSNFVRFHKRICSMKLIPLVIIKTFIFNTFYLDYIKPIPVIEKCLELANPQKYKLAQECFFMRYFKTFTALDTNYPDASSKKRKMCLFSIENLNSISNITTEYESIFDVAISLYNNIDKIILNDVTIQESINNDKLIEFVKFQLSNFIDPTTDQYKFISGEKKINSMDMIDFNGLAHEYEEYISDNPEYSINRTNYLKFIP